MRHHAVASTYAERRANLCTFSNTRARRCGSGRCADRFAAPCHRIYCGPTKRAQRTQRTRRTARAAPVC